MCRPPALGAPARVRGEPAAKHGGCMSRFTARWFAGCAAAVAVASVLGALTAAQSGSAGVRPDGNDIAGVVASAKGPEAGVWVIAETTDLPTGFRKIVVTDDRGRYLVPDLP